MSEKKNKNLTNTLKNSTSRLGLRALEPRILLDAAGFVTGADVAMDALDTQGVAEDMAVLFETNSTSNELSEEVTQAEALIRDLLEIDADKNLLAPAVIDDGVKDYGVKAQSVVVTDGNGKDYALIAAVTDNGTVMNSGGLTDDGNYEIHSGETINVDSRCDYFFECK